MKIAFGVTEFVIESSFSGGLANYTERMAISLGDRGHSVEIFVISDREESIFHKEILIHRVLPKRSLFLRLLRVFQSLLGGLLLHRCSQNLAVIIGLFQALKKRDKFCHFDIVQYTHLGGVGFLHGSKAASIVRLSSYAELWFPYGFKKNYSTPFQRWLEDIAIKRADTVVAPSSMVGEFVQSRLGIPVHIIESPFVPPDTNAEDPSVFLQHWQEKMGQRRAYGLYFGSLAEWKGIWVLTDALNRLLKIFPDIGFIFIGKNSSSRDGLPAAEWISRQLRCYAARLLIWPPLRHPQLFPFIRNASFVALPSLMDNLPNTMLEAMWLKKLVIGTKGRSFDQLIEHNKSGLLCDPGDPESLLAEMIKAVSMSDDEKQRIGQQAHVRVCQLSSDKIGRRFEKLYFEALHFRKHL
jgi:glycosyltransferase involved in cell wall biosynthesis